MKIKTSELTGAALDWATAKAVQLPIYQCGEGWPGNRFVNEESLRRPIVTVGLTGRMLLEGPKASENKEWSPSTDWAQGGPLIQMYEIDLKVVAEGVWQASNFFNDLAIHRFLGDSPLVAAMRCYVAHKLGEEVEIPKELYED